MDDAGPRDVRAAANNIDECLEGVMLIDGAVGAALVDWTSGLVYLHSDQTSDEISVAAAGTAEIVLAEIRLMTAVGVRDRIEDIVITLGSRYHLVRLVRSYPAFYLYLVLDREHANLGMARIQLSEAEETLVLEHQRRRRTARDDSESAVDGLVREAAM